MAVGILSHPGRGILFKWRGLFGERWNALKKMEWFKLLELLPYSKHEDVSGWENTTRENKINLTVTYKTKAEKKT